MTLRMVYVAYPIDSAEGARVTNAVEVAQKGLIEAGVDIVFDPGDAFKLREEAEPGPEIALVDGLALDLADGVMVFLPSNTVTVGTPIEMDRALKAGKPVAIISDMTGSWMLGYGYENATRWGFNDWFAAVEWLARQEPVEVQREKEEEPDPLPVKYLTERQEMELTGPHMPYRAHEDDAGLDLIVARDMILPPGVFVDLPTEIAVELPDWSWGFITARSSTWRKRRIQVTPGVIDHGYRGELYVGVVSHNDENVEVQAGERLAQLIVIPNGTKMVDPIRVEELNGHKRGTNGFGSSGA